MLVENTHATSDPATIDVVRRSGLALKGKRPDEAERLARTAIARDPAYVPARLALGRALEAQKRPAEAAAVYAEAARISPFSPGVSKSLRRVSTAPLAGFGLVAAIVWGVLRVVGRQFDEHTVLAGLLVSTAVLIVGTLVVLQRQRRRFASLSEDDRRLLEVHGGGRLFVGPRAGRIVLVGGVIVALSAAAILFAVGTKPSLGMKVGDCFTLDKVSSIEQVSAIPCDLPHGTEVYASVEDPAPAGAAYPGVETVRASAKAGCEAAYVQFVGAPYTAASKLRIYLLTPEEPYWANGVRTVWCSIQDPHGQQSSSSAKGSGR